MTERGFNASVNDALLKLRLRRTRTYTATSSNIDIVMCALWVCSASMLAGYACGATIRPAAQVCFCCSLYNVLFRCVCVLYMRELSIPVCEDVTQLEIDTTQDLPAHLM